MDQKDKIKKELEDISPFLAKLKKENPFEVPANYFERLPDQIMEQARLTRVERPPTKVFWLDRLTASLAFMLRPQMAFALLCLVAFTWAGTYMWKSQTKTLASQENYIEKYIADHIDEFDMEILAQSAFGQSERQENALLNDLEIDEGLMNEILDELEGADIEDLL